MEGALVSDKNIATEHYLSGFALLKIFLLLGFYCR